MVRTNKPVKLRLKIHPMLKLYLERLVKTGVYGNNIEDAANRLICSRLEYLLENGNLERLERFAPSSLSIGRH